ncbi:hypothetical protein PPERSA_09914 [Pseudocohnilembus persalinus]|uniref:Uncharacterized protein n=1 Tax=Pseudocohnilembus persalinus TaxID=266149 RepID=A0A0V0QJ81_PSEPJ|nr:hypothetical protein PPERSA_09914 [Pseudocohnilembus persalinus]|eukprot:KRX02297.1 hypothetical protein PPERSA_09914 [Pseudocohnilembus persalinus]
MQKKANKFYDSYKEKKQMYEEDLNLNFYKSNGEFTESKVKRGDINTLTYSPTNRESNSYNPEQVKIEKFQNACSKFNEQVANILKFRLVEKLGSIMPNYEKQNALHKFDQIWKDLITILDQITDIIQTIDFQYDELAQSRTMPVNEQFIREIKLIENTFYDLVQTSSLRFMHKCTEIYRLNEYNINLEYNIRNWYINNRDYINKFSKKKSSQTNKKSFMGSFCPCFPKTAVY